VGRICGNSDVAQGLPLPQGKRIATAPAGLRNDNAWGNAKICHSEEAQSADTGIRISDGNHAAHYPQCSAGTRPYCPEGLTRFSGFIL